MDLASVFLVFGLIVVGAAIVAAAILGERAARRARLLEKEKNEAWARDNGFEYTGDGGMTGIIGTNSESVPALVHLYKGMAGVDDMNGKFLDFFRGEVEGMEFHGFEYEYVVSTGKSAYKQRRTVWSLACDVDVADFRLGKASWSDFFNELLGEHDIKTGNEAFDKKFRLLSDNPESVRRMFNEYVTDYLAKNFGGRMVRSRGRFVLVEDGEISVEMFPARARFFHEFWDEIPRELKK